MFSDLSSWQSLWSQTNQLSPIDLVYVDLLGAAVVASVVTTLIATVFFYSRKAQATVNIPYVGVAVDNVPTAHKKFQTDCASLLREGFEMASIFSDLTNATRIATDNTVPHSMGMDGSR